MLKIGYGIADYRTLIQGGKHFVDRTQYLEVMERFPSPYLTFLRPRRFGKSLWISILQYYYGIQHKDQFEELFGKYHIGKNPTPLANSYYMLRMNFSGISTDTDEKLQNSFTQSVKRSIERFFGDYPQIISKEVQSAILSGKEANDVMNAFFQKVGQIIPQKIYLLIDEYDHFANELIAFRFQSFQGIVSKNGWVRKFYEVIKIAANEGTLDRLFITGVSPITLDSMTSGFNIVRNITTDLGFHSLMGFTENEVKEILEGVQVDKIRIPDTMAVLKEWYNGYKFNVDSPELVYNSDMVLYFAGEYGMYQKHPRRMLDTNIASDYTKISRIFGIGNLQEERWQYVDALMRNEPVEIEMTEMFSFEAGFSTPDFLSLLFYMGFLTIKEEALGQSVYLGMPNRVIANLYRDYFIRIMNERSGMGMDIIYLQEAIHTLMRDNNPRPVLDILCKTLTQLSHRDFQKLDEKHVQAMFFCYVNLNQSYDTTSEYQSEKKYYDILMLKNGLANSKTIHEFLFEFKYVRKATEERLGKIDNEAKSQIMNYLQHKKVANHPNLHAWRIVIVGDKLEVCEEMER